MSPDSEDSALEEALRGDLPSPATSARLRRRLVAAGLAVGNGVATAAAAGATPGVVSGVVGKGLALSWGVKLGALAVVAIPTVGLLVESRAEPELAAPAPAMAAPANPARSPERAASPVAQPAAPAPSEPVAAAPVTRAERAANGDAVPVPATSPLPPSEGDFAPTDPIMTGKVKSTLAEETRILDGAFAELSAGRAARAAQLIAEHQQRFPNGLLQKERERARARLSEISRGE